MIVELSPILIFSMFDVFKKNLIIYSLLALSGCNTTFHLDPYFALNLTYDLHHIGDHNTCTYQFTSVYMEHLIRISFPYPGSVENAADFAHHTSDSCREEENFIHIGNDLEAVGRNSWSSFLFCLDARVPPFVSRGDTAWLVVSTVHDITISITVESLPHGKTINAILHVTKSL